MIGRSENRKWLFFVIAILVSGCVVPTVSKEKYIPPASDNLDELAVIHVYRARAFFRSGNDIDILIDGEVAGEIGNGGSLAILVVPGTHTIAPYDWSSPAQAPVFTYGNIGNPVEHDFQGGTVYYIRWKPRSIKEPNADMFQFTNETMHRERR